MLESLLSRWTSTKGLDCTKASSLSCWFHFSTSWSALAFVSLHRSISTVCRTASIALLGLQREQRWEVPRY